MSKLEELAGKMLKKEEAKEKKCTLAVCIVGAVLVIAAIAGIAYAVYRFMKPDDLEDFDDDFDDEFDYDDDFFDDDDDFEEVEEAAEDVVDDTVE